MGKFFESDMVREELIEINQLQMEIYSSTMSFPSMSRKDKLEHIDKLTELLEKQKIMYARLSLSDDPEAKELLSTLKSSVALMGFPPNMDMNSFFDNVYVFDGHISHSISFISVPFLDIYVPSSHTVHNLHSYSFIFDVKYPFIHLLQLRLIDLVAFSVMYHPRSHTVQFLQ